MSCSTCCHACIALSPYPLSPSSVQDEECEVLSATSSSFEGFVTTKNFAICLPHRQWTQVTRGGVHVCVCVCVCVCV